MKPKTAIAVLAGVTLGAVVASDHALANRPTPPSPPSIDLAATARGLVSTTSRPPVEQDEDEDASSPGEPGKRKGRFQLTYYWMAAETRGGPKVQLYNKHCRRVARVSRAFERQLRLEGGGVLRNGRVLTYSGRCRCPHSPCYRTARRGHRWGTGVRERPLSPFRSVAVDPRHVSIGTTLYIPEFDGLIMPGRKPWGGFVHDGCVVADDQGGGVRGRQIDLFSARKGHYRALQRRHRLKKVTVFEGGERCQSLTRRLASRPGSS